MFSPSNVAFKTVGMIIRTPSSNSANPKQRRECPSVSVDQLRSTAGGPVFPDSLYLDARFL